MHDHSPLTALAVRAGRTLLAIPVRRIHALHSCLRHPPPTPLPDSPPWLLGLVDGPAGLTPVVHLAALGGAAGEPVGRACRLLLFSGRPPLALRVEEARGLIRLRRTGETAPLPDPGLAPYLEAGFGDGDTPWWLLRLAALAEHPALRRKR